MFKSRGEKMLNRVTLTGADDDTNIAKMVDTSGEFPFVEWGILVGSHAGKRFPSVAWIRELAEAVNKIECNLSLHICGKWLREIASGRTSLNEHIGPAIGAFGRCQLNWHGERQGFKVGENVLGAFFNLYHQFWEPEIIFQLDGINDNLCEPSQRKFACTGLFDKSHGAGVVADEWPHGRRFIGCGWAGGLGPDNLAAELPRIHEKAWPAMNYWVDMETKLRNDADEFDLDRCRQCLEIAKKFMDDQSSKNGDNNA